jgi:REP-associated tyrosine transposase
MDHVGAGFKPAPTESTLLRRHGLPEIIRAFKTFSSRCINQLRRTSGTPVWQRNYYEHIIRNDDDLHEVRRYIDDNPARWAEDEYYKV